MVFLIAACPAQSQLAIQFPFEHPDVLVRDALAHPYGRALIAEFAKTVMEDADAACLRSKGLNAGTLSERGRELFQRWGTRSMETLFRNIDVRIFESKLSERAGSGALAEMARLMDDPDVKQFLALERPVRLAKVVDSVIENFERYVLLNRLRLRSFSGISTGNDALLSANPTEAADEAMEKFVTDNTSPPFKRYYELSEIMAAALLEAFNRDVALKWGPRTFFGGVENDLAELCVTSR